jgi:periplasmic divalent cation tolerance protein
MHLVAMTTAPTPEKAAELARALVEERLAACVNILPGARSIYRWQGKLEDDTEAVCVIKTRRDRLDALRARLLELHPYEVPELVVMDVVAGNPKYLAWIDESVG